MPVNERYPLPDVIAACEAFYERKRRKVFVEYVMLAGVNDSFAQAAQLAEVLDPADVQGQPDPVQPDRTRASTGSSPKAIAAFKDELERQGLGATVRLTRGRDIDAACGQLARAGLAGPEQPLAQLRLELGRRVELASSRQLVERAQAEQPQEQLAGPVQDRAELRAAGLLDQPALEQRRRGRLGVDAADPGDLGPRDRLQVGDDRERLGLGRGQRRRARAGPAAAAPRARRRGGSTAPSRRRARAARGPRRSNS